MTAATSAETMWVRERLTEMLETKGFHLVVESMSRRDGWRAELLRPSEEGDDVVLTAHKPDDAPYVSVGVFAGVDPPERVSAWAALVDCASDFETSFWFREERPCCVLTTRMFALSLDPETFDFQLGNLLACRAAIIELASDELDVQADVRGRPTADPDASGEAGGP